jgi:hypothetical protein
MVDYHSVARLLLKLFGVALILYAFTITPQYLMPMAANLDGVEFGYRYYVAVLMPLTVPLILGVFLWLFPSAVANTVIPVSARPQKNEWALQIERIAISAIGIYVLFGAISDLVYHLATLVARNVSAGPAPNFGALMIATVAETGIALYLVFRSQGIANLLRRFREVGVPR